MILMGKKTYWQGKSDENRQMLFEDLSYEYFAEHVGYEYFFKYKEKTIDIATYKENKRNIYHISINDQNDFKCENGTHQYFDSPEELLKNGRIDGKTIKEIWDDLEN